MHDEIPLGKYFKYKNDEAKRTGKEVQRFYENTFDIKLNFTV